MSDHEMHNTALLITYGKKKKLGKITSKKLGQYRCCLINGILNTLAP
jgi:hypothetical protein